MINKFTPKLVIGAFLLFIPLFFPVIGPIGDGMATDSIGNEKINLNINEVFALENTTSVRYERTFSLSEKQPVSLLHIDCQGIENSIRNVFVNVSLNGIESSKSFMDSNIDYDSPHTFSVGTTLPLRINPATPVYVLSNTITIEITVQTSSYFGSEKGLFLVDKVIFETFTPPTITSTSENIQLPLLISEGVWYISSLTTLKERRLESEVFADVSEKTRLDFDITLSPNDVPLSLTRLEVSAGLSSFESTKLSLEHSIIIDVKPGDTIKLVFRFRPSSNLATDTIGLNLDVSVSGLPYIEPNNPSGTNDETEVIDLPISFLEIIRVLVIIVPIFFLYIRKKKIKLVKLETKAKSKA